MYQLKRFGKRFPEFEAKLNIGSLFNTHFCINDNNDIFTRSWQSTIRTPLATYRGRRQKCLYWQIPVYFERDCVQTVAVLDSLLYSYMYSVILLNCIISSINLNSFHKVWKLYEMYLNNHKIRYLTVLELLKGCLIN